MRAWVIWLLGLSLSVWAAEDPVLAVIGDEKITAGQVRAYVKKRPLLAGYLATGYPGWRRVLVDLIDLRLLNREGERLKIPREAEDDEDLYALRVKRKLLPPCAKPDEKGAKRFYQEHPERFSTPAFVRLNRLELPVSAQIEGKPAIEFLQEAGERVRAGEKNLAELAELCPQGKACLQDLGFVRTEAFAELGEAGLKALQTAKVGEVVGPLVVGEWVYLYQVTARREPILAPWEQVQAEAAEEALRFCRSEAFARLRQDLYRRYGVVLHEKALQTLR
ncbi:hypothetical protein JCM13664_13060 [Methylothermus subterraneus]